MISIITWDAGFRENYHTVDSFCRQNYNLNDFEFIWVEFYSSIHPTLANKINSYPNARVLCLNNAKTTKWHLGKCLNAGINDSKGNLLVIPDGDIIVPDNFIKIVEEEHYKIDELVLYFRRWDEQEIKHDLLKSYEIDYLEKVCQLNNPTNYAGCLAIKKEHFHNVGGYEESPIFSGPGANGSELYTRLKNKGYAIKWHNTSKIYHPFHTNTGISDTDKKEMERLKRMFHWLIPYAGVEQSWVIRSRELELSCHVDEKSVSHYVQKLPFIPPPSEVIQNKPRSVYLLKYLKSIYKSYVLR